MGASLESGGVFAGYRILRRLGAGGMGTVYLAEHPNLPRLVALKVLNRALTDDEDVRARFLREADTAARLDHRNIVTVYDRGNEGGQLWIAMQYVDGCDVAELLRDGGLPVARAVWIITETAAALDYAHGHGVLHRDVKPANILLTDASRGEPERVVLADFGIAKALDETCGLTRSGNLLASLQYAAPEQFDIGATIDHRVDVYSLGATLYRMLTGALPYPGSTPAQLMYGHLSLPIPKPSQHCEMRVPEGFDAIVERALAKDREGRYSSCGELAAAANDTLAAASKELTATVSSPTAPPKSKMMTEGIPAVGGAEHASTMKPAVVPGTPVRKRRVHRRLLAVAAAAVAIIAAVAVVLIWPKPPPHGSLAFTVSPVAVGKNPQGVAVDATTHNVYVANTTGGTVSILDGTTLAVTATIGNIPSAQGVAVDPQTRTVYVTDYADAGKVFVIDANTNTVTATIAVGANPDEIAVDPHTHLVYVTNVTLDPLAEGQTGPRVASKPGSVSVIDPRARAVTATVGVGIRPIEVVFDADRSRLYVGMDGDNSVSVIDVSTNTVAATVAVGQGPLGLALDHRSGTLYVANNVGDSIWTIDTHTNRVTGAIPVHRPSMIAIDQDRRIVYVGVLAATNDPNTSDLTPVAIDADTHKVTPIPGSGRAIASAAVDPGTGAAYLVDYNDSAVYVVRP
ncbi:protein kinase domain-containing protein [Nocardia tengchongensis]|uniref:protein kinase domain-containing protein n=1 Tax=Nocardia tengchongensis TaxID=2055889 RepID=UPI0036BA6932